MYRFEILIIKKFYADLYDVNIQSSNFSSFKVIGFGKASWPGRAGSRDSLIHIHVDETPSLRSLVISYLQFRVARGTVYFKLKLQWVYVYYSVLEKSLLHMELNIILNTMFWCVLKYIPFMKLRKQCRVINLIFNIYLFLFHLFNANYKALQWILSSYSVVITIQLHVFFK